MSIRNFSSQTAGTQAAGGRRARRAVTLSLELQSAAKFALAIAVGLAVVLASTPDLLAGLVLVVAVIVAGRALVVLGTDPRHRAAVRPSAEASTDAAMAGAWAAIALALAAQGAFLGALAAGAGAIGLAFLRLRTRYVL